MADLEQIVMRIQVVDPNCQVYLISAKPSPSRWDKKQQYLELNEAMKSYTEKKENVGFVDVWTPMLDEDGNPKSDIFLQDQLHMNKTGYDIWREIFAKYFPEETPQ
jgi:lysophospholipase L1-like esterase